MTLTWRYINRQGHHHRDKEINQNIVKKIPINSVMVRRLEQSVETVAGGDFCLLSSQIIKFIKNQASKLNNHKMSEKIMSGEKFHLIAMTTNTSAVCVNYRLDTNDVSAIKETSHTVCLSFNQSFFFFLCLHSPSTAARLAIGCCHGNSPGSFTQPGQREEFDRKHVRADQIPGVSAQGNQGHICEYYYFRIQFCFL